MNDSRFSSSRGVTRVRLAGSRQWAYLGRWPLNPLKGDFIECFKRACGVCERRPVLSFQWSRSGEHSWFKAVGIFGKMTPKFPARGLYRMLSKTCGVCERKPVLPFQGSQWGEPGWFKTVHGKFEKMTPKSPKRGLNRVLLKYLGHVHEMHYSVQSLMQRTGKPDCL